VIRAKGRVAVAACMKEGGKKLIWDEATVFMRKLLHSLLAGCMQQFKLRCHNQIVQCTKRRRRNM